MISKMTSSVPNEFSGFTGLMLGERFFLELHYEPSALAVNYLKDVKNLVDKLWCLVLVSNHNWNNFQGGLENQMPRRFKSIYRGMWPQSQRETSHLESYETWNHRQIPLCQKAVSVIRTYVECYQDALLLNKPTYANNRRVPISNEFWSMMLKGDLVGTWKSNNQFSPQLWIHWGKIDYQSSPHFVAR